MIFMVVDDFKVSLSSDLNFMTINMLLPKDILSGQRTIKTRTNGPKDIGHHNEI